MYERFTDRARKVMQLANQEAQSFNHEYIGTEHVLLGLIQEGNGVAANVLKNLGLDLLKIRREVERLVRPGPNVVTMVKLPMTPRTKKIIEYTMEECRDLGHNYVGTEHILLGLLREEEGVGAQVLMNFGLNLHDLRKEVLLLLGHDDKALLEEIAFGPSIAMSASATASFVAVDIGNSQIKFGKFRPDDAGPLPEPIATLDLRILHETGAFNLTRLAEWCEQHLTDNTAWLVASVHRGATSRLTSVLASWAKQSGIDWPIRPLTYRDVPLTIRLGEPAHIGIDRLFAAVAANRLRNPERAAIIVDMGTAITVDLLAGDGAFAGGAILPGIAMSARALAEQTDALPHVAMEQLEKPPSPLGKSTEAAIQSGLYWGAVGAIGELISRLSSGLSAAPEIFVTGGASEQVAALLAERATVRHVPHLVLSGIALVDGMKDV